MNLFLTDGRSIVACAWGDSLWLRDGPDGTLVASEPDDDQPDAEQPDAEQPDADQPGARAWRELPDRTLLVVEPGRIVCSALGGVATPDATVKGAA
jgi:glutamine amidotransferase